VEPMTNVFLTSIKRGDRNIPAVTFVGDPPEIGSVVAVTLKNGVTYTGTVYDTVFAGGETLVEFTDGLTPSKPSLQRR